MSFANCPLTAEHDENGSSAFEILWILQITLKQENSLKRALLNQFNFCMKYHLKSAIILMIKIVDALCYVVFGDLIAFLHDIFDRRLVKY